MNSSPKNSNVVDVDRFVTLITSTGAQFEIDRLAGQFRRIKPNKARREPGWLSYKSLTYDLGRPIVVTLLKSGKIFKSQVVIAIMPFPENRRQGLLV